jgi:hypothetical protein
VLFVKESKESRFGLSISSCETKLWKGAESIIDLLTGYKILKDGKVLKLIFRYRLKPRPVGLQDQWNNITQKCLAPVLLANPYFKDETEKIPSLNLPSGTSFAKINSFKEMKVNTLLCCVREACESSHQPRKTDGKCGPTGSLCQFNVEFLEWFLAFYFTYILAYLLLRELDWMVPQGWC